MKIANYEQESFNTKPLLKAIKKNAVINRIKKISERSRRSAAEQLALSETKISFWTRRRAVSRERIYDSQTEILT